MAVSGDCSSLRCTRFSLWQLLSYCRGQALFPVGCGWASQLALVVKNPAAKAGDIERPGFDPWVGKIPWRREWQPTPVFLPGEPHGLTPGQRSLAGYSPCGRKESDTTEAT